MARPCDFNNASKLPLPSCPIKYDNKFSGLYTHDSSDTGGPFFSYVFDNDNKNEVTFISCFVNNPGKNKYYILKQLDVLIKNKQ